MGRKKGKWKGMGGEGEEHYIPSKQTLFLEKIKKKKTTKL